MRKTAIAIALVLVASLGIIVPSVAAASGDPKVVIIVGATHGATAGYRADANVAYAEAIRYTSNVVKVYSPNATWAKVKAAVAGASIVIYMGHGNGWPSPYTYDPKFTTKDGFGLNTTAGAGDSNNKYYGEPSIATLDFAPGAIVLLHHLCYAAGNSEPGNPEPSVTVARQRADNYAAGFLKAGASAVIADGHAGAERYLRALFTTHQSIEDMWRTMPNANGNFVSFASGRTHGATVYQDPNTPTSGFYRSLTIGTIGVTTDEVISAGYGDTAANPGSLVVPGNAAVATEGASLYGGLDTMAVATPLPAGTRLRLIEQPGALTAEGVALVEVKGIDDDSITGFMAASDLAARDSAAPVVRALDPGGSFSPNGDGRVDKAQFRGRFTEAVAWTLSVRQGSGPVLFEKTGTGTTLDVAWDGIVGGAPAPDGTYQVSVTGVDAWDNTPAQAARSVAIDTVAPTAPSVTPGAATAQWFSPNGDGFRDTATVSATNPEPGALVARVLDADGDLVKTWSVENGSAAVPVSWNGRTTAGASAADGVYTMDVAAQDRAGNIGPGVQRPVTLIAALRSVASSRSIFFPQDLDSLAKSTSLSFALARPMTVTWTLRDAAGRTVETHLDAASLPAGTQSWSFNGRVSSGAMLPRGRYTSVVTATDGTLSATQAVAFELDAFRIKLSDSTPKRGQSITFTVTSPEALARRPSLYVYQPKVARWSVRMTKTGTYTYKITVRMKSSGRSGPVSFKVKGVDTKHGNQSTTVVYTIH